MAENKTTKKSSKKKNYYAVRKGHTTGLFTSWPECQEAVRGFSGAEFKGFYTKEEAMAYLTGESLFLQEGTGPDENDLIVYVDGSFDASLKRYAYGCIFLLPEGEEALSGCGNDPGLLPLRNVAGEMLGAMKAVQWAIRHQFGSVQLRYDYSGIEMWVTGVWETKNEYTQKYAAYMRGCQEKIAVSFKKVEAHSGNPLNDAVDQLAKDALRAEPGSH